ncbi:MAG: hypothetical protein ACREQ5_21705, partial [Candidatus Dormibacteria bacterium]
IGEYRHALLLCYLLVERLGGSTEFSTADFAAATGGKLRVAVDQERKVLRVLVLRPEATA